MAWFRSDPTRPLPDEPSFPPVGPNRPVVLLADATSRLERDLIASWSERHAPSGLDLDLIQLRPSRRRRRRQTDPRLAARLQRGDDPWVVPVRVVWLPSERGGRRSASWVDVLKLGDPRDPDPLREHAILSLYPDRVRLVVGDGAGAGELVTAHRESVEVMSLVEFVTRRAHLALERAERRLRGNRYKVPKFLHAEILSRADFRDGVVQIASERGLPPELAFARARYYLREIAASHSPFLIDLIANAIHWLYRQGYGAILYDPERVREIAALGQEHALAFLPSHRSHLDRLSMQYLLWENDLPPNHTAAGINMNFFPVGPLIRRTGAFFIRRSFKDNPLYKFVLRSYLDYLIENRFPLEWYMEGGRSRSGKLLPPRYGMLGWVVDSVRRDKAEDLYLIPTSIAYDQIQDVHDYAKEAQGGEKRKESFSWALGAIRSLRRRYGNIHVRFAEPISVSKELAEEAGQPDNGVDLDLQKLAFEVMYRISQVTPITPTSVVSIVLLAGRGRGMDAAEMARRCAELDAWIEVQGFPVTEPLRLEDPGEVARVADQLAAHGSVSTFAHPDGTVYHLTPSQALQAAYYRNTVVHYFVPGAIAELALLAPPGADPQASFWEEVFSLRDFLKFEFFFSQREEFRAEVASRLATVDPGWESRLGEASERRTLVEEIRPLRAHWALLPFIEAYQITADELVDGEDPSDEKRFLQACLLRGGRYRLEGRVAADESVSKALFASALNLARNRGIGGDDEDPAARQRFSDEVNDVRRRALEVGEIADRRGRTVAV